MFSGNGVTLLAHGAKQRGPKTEIVEIQGRFSW
jgi:hypothetical protein